MLAEKFLFIISRFQDWPRWLIRFDRGSKLSQRYWVRFPAGSDVCLWGCAYTVLQTVQRPGLCSAVNGTVHYKEPLNHSIRVGHSHDIGLPSVAILPWLCRKRHKTIFTQSLWVKYVFDHVDLVVCIHVYDMCTHACGISCEEYACTCRYRTHKTLDQHWPNVGSLSAKMAQQ